MAKVVISVIVFSLFVNCLATTDVCLTCKCNDTHIDCTRQNLTNENIIQLVWKTDVVYQVVNLDFNNLLNLPQLPPFSARKLSLKHNTMTNLAVKAFIDIANLTEVDLSSNDLTTDILIGDIFEGHFSPEYNMPLLDLRILNLEQNSLHSLRHDVFKHLPNIEELSLKANGFKVIDSPTMQAIGSLYHLKVLILANNNLKNLPEGFLHTSAQLTTLDLTLNSFVEVPHDALAETHKLEVLILSENPIVSIPTEGGFPTLETLKELHLKYMPFLERIEAHSLSSLTNLEVFNCQMNQNLAFISDLAFSHTDTPLKELYINDNALLGLNKSILSRWDLMRMIDLRGNRWSCDCENQWMIDELFGTIQSIENNTGKKLTESLSCYHPIEMRGRTFSELYKRHYQLRCLDAYGNHPEKDSAMLIGVFIGVIVVIPLMTVAYLVWTRKLVNCRRGSQTLYSRASYSQAIVDYDDKY